MTAYEMRISDWSSDVCSSDLGTSRIDFTIEPRHFHAAGAAHGTSYFKMMDDAAFYACNSLVTDRFLLTTAFHLNFTRPLKGGEVIAEGRWVSGRRRVFVGDARLIDAAGEEAARGTGTSRRPHISLTTMTWEQRRVGKGGVNKC